MELSTEQLWDIVSGDLEGWQQLKGTRHIEDQSRWLTSFAAVFQHTPSGRHFEIIWDRPSTEMQDGSPCEISYCEVRQEEVTVSQWVPVPKGDDDGTQSGETGH